MTGVRSQLDGVKLLRDSIVSTPDSRVFSWLQGKRAQEVSRAGNIVILVMDPVDLAVSKVARFSDRDREDIRQLAAQGLVDPLLFAERMEEALDYYVGDTTFVRRTFEEAKEIVAREGDVTASS